MGRVLECPIRKCGTLSLIPRPSKLPGISLFQLAFWLALAVQRYFSSLLRYRPAATISLQAALVSPNRGLSVSVIWLASAASVTSRLLAQRSGFESFCSLRLLQILHRHLSHWHRLNLSLRQD